MRRNLAVLGLAIGALTLSCSGDGSNLAPSDAPRTNAAITATTSRCGPLKSAVYDELITTLGKLYRVGSSDYKTIKGMIDDMKTKLNYTKADKTTDAQSKAVEILIKVIGDWSKGRLMGTLVDAQHMVDLLYQAACLGAGTQLPADRSKFGTGVITPTGGTVLTGDRQAGVLFPAGAVSVTTIVTITPASTRLNTPLDQYPPTYEFLATPHDPASPFGADLTVGICLDPTIDATVFGRLQLAHNIVSTYSTPNRFGDIEIMPTATTTALGLSCPDLFTGSAAALDRWKSYAAALFLPQPLQASSAALLKTNLGGTTRTLSPFAAVDPQIQLSINAGDGQTALVGTNVAVAPSVLAKTNLGTNVPGVPVAFAVTAGGGTISPTINVPTDPNGVAAATSWTLGPNAGANTATGAGQAISQLTYSPTSVTFNATGTEVILDYGAEEFRYQQSGRSGYAIDTTGFTAGGYDDSGWSLGNAAFGSANASCTLNTNGSVKTPWAPSTDLLVRRQFSVGGSPTARVSVAIDNDIKVFVNGTNVTSSAKVDGTNTSPSFDANGFAMHENCPAQGSLTFDVSGLNEGSNLLVIYAHDRGVSTYLDVKVVIP